MSYAASSKKEGKMDVLANLRKEINQYGIRLGLIVFVAIFLAMLAALTISKKF